ncbi:H-NS histone family protein [Orrella sp. JC864]|uniref:H-NS histone family protein n=1 Tax=Orrella sp. JC864 TaxID=3120298 RepID=UPI0012BB9023
MPRESYAALQAKLEREISKLQKKKDALQNRRRKPVIDSIVKSMREYEITPEEIAAAFSSKARPRRSPRKTAGATAARKPVAPKYRHPDTGETWSGRGKPPRWLAAAEEQGASRESFLIK